MSNQEIYTNNPLIAEASGQEITLADEILLNDFSSMNANSFIDKYGQDTFDSLVQQRIATDQAADAVLGADTRTWGEASLDTAKNIISGALSGAVGAASFVTTPIRPVSEGLAKLNKDINKISNDLGSKAEQAQRQWYEFEQQGLKARLDREVKEAESQGKSVSTFERIGKEVLGSAENLFKTGQYSEMMASGLGSLAIGGPMTKGVSKVASVLGSKVPSLANTVNQLAFNSAVIQKIKDAAPWMVSMGLQEGGGTYGDLLLAGLDISAEELMANSPEFQTLYANYRKAGYTDGDAKESAKNDLAYAAARRAGIGTAIGAGLANYLTAGMAKGLDKASLARSIINPIIKQSDKSLDKFIAEGLSEPLEEGITEGIGQFTTNLAKREFLDKNQQLDEDIGQSIAEGSIGGLGITGLRAGTGTASEGIKQARKAYLENKAKQEAKKIKSELDIKITTPSESPMRISDDIEDTRTPTQVAIDSIEEVNQNSEINASLFNPETSIKDGESGFDSASLDLDAETKEKYQVNSKAELLNKFVKTIVDNNKEVPVEIKNDVERAIINIVQDLTSLSTFLNKVNSGTVSISSDEEKALRAQYKALIAAKKNFLALSKEQDVPQNLEAEKTAYDAIYNPETITLERLDKALKSSNSLDSQSKEVISNMRNFYAQEELNTSHRKQIKEISPNTSIVSENVIWGQDEAYKESGKFSLKQMAIGVYKGITEGKPEQAKTNLENVHKLIQHFENKIDALNSSYQNGGASTKFNQLDPKTKSFNPSGKVSWKPGNSNSLSFARAVEYDLARTVQAYNHLVSLAPELGLAPVTNYKHLINNAGAGTEVPTLQSSAQQGEVQVSKQEPVISNQETSENPEPEMKEEQITSKESTEVQADVIKTELQPSEEDTDEYAQIEPSKKEQRKLIETIDQPKEIKAFNSIKEAFKKLKIASIFKQRSSFGSRLSLKNLHSKFDILNVINSREAKEEFLSYDSHADKVLAETKLTKEERTFWSNLIKTTRDSVTKNINDRALKHKKAIAEKESKGEIYPKTGIYYLNFLEGNKFPNELTEAISLATISSLAQVKPYTDNDEDLMESLGLSLETWNKLPVETQDAFRQSIYTNGLLSDIVKKSKEYLNIKADDKLQSGYTDGTLAALAHGALETLLNSSDSSLALEIIEVKTPNIVNGKTTLVKTHKILRFKNPMPEELLANSFLLDKLILNSSDFVYPEYWEDQPIPVDKTVSHTSIPLLPAQQQAIANRQKVEYNFNETMFNAINKMGIKGVIEFFSEDISGNENVLHPIHVKSVEGRNLEYRRAFYILNKDFETAKELATNSDKPIDQVKRHYKYNISKLGRLQMEGSITPQGNKLCREVISATKSVVDLSDSNSKTYEYYIRCLAQGFGIKVNNFTYPNIKSKFDDIVNTSAFKQIQEYFAKENPSLDDIKNLKKAFDEIGIDKTVVGFACARDYCQFLNTSDKDKKNYTTYVYLEADGVTNGTANLLMLANPEYLDEASLNALRRVGVNIGNSDATSLAQIKEQYPEAEKDTYTWIANKASNELNNIEPYKEIFSFFDDWDFKENAFKRNVVKNPVTTVGYGAGVPTLSGKLFHDLSVKFYKKISDANKKYKNSYYAKKGLNWDVYFTGLDTKDNLAKYSTQELNKLAIERIRKLNTYAKSLSGQDLIPENVLVARGTNPKTLLSRVNVVKFLNNREESFIDLAKVIDFASKANLGANIQDRYSGSTGVMGYFNTLNTRCYVFQKYLYESLVNKARANLPGKGFGLSPEQRKKILDAVNIFALIPSSGIQQVVPVKIAKEKNSRFIYRTDNTIFNGDKLTVKYSPEEFTPSNPGVTFLPHATVGFGDATMMSILSNTERNTDVFDGLNSPIDRIEDDALLANKAVYSSWQLNLGTVVKKAYKKATGNIDQNFFEDFLTYLSENPSNEITKAFFNTLPNVFQTNSIAFTKNSSGKISRITVQYGSNNYTKSFTPTTLYKLINQDTFEQLDTFEVDLAKKKAAFESLGISVDQMASSENPYYQKGTLNRVFNEDTAIISEFNYVMANAKTTPSSLDSIKVPEINSNIPEAKQPKLEESLEAEKPEEPSKNELEKISIENLFNKDEIKVEVPEEEIKVNRNTLKLDVTSLSNVLKNGLTPKQQKLYKAIKGLSASAFLKEYSIYAGSKAEMNALIKEDGGETLFDGKTEGIFDPKTKTLYVLGKNPTTLFHEMVHAFVADKVHTVCEQLGNDFSIRTIPGIQGSVVTAVVALKDIVGEFIEEDFGLETNPRVVEVQGILKQLMAEGDISAAINEMIAYSLSDENIAQYLYEKKSFGSRLADTYSGWEYSFKKYFSKVLGCVKKILFGTYSRDPDDTLLDEVVFHTRVIHSGGLQQASLGKALRAISSELRAKIPAFKQISDLVTQAIQKNPSISKRLTIYRNNTIPKLFKDIQQKIPSMDASEINAASLILEAFLGVTKVHPEVFSRISDMYQYARSKVTVEDFMKDPTDASQRPIAEGKYYALFGDNIPLRASSNLHIPTFFAIALASSEVKDILKKIDVKRVKESKKEFFLDRKLDEAGSYVINKLSDLVNSTSSQTVDDLLNALADSLIKTSLEEGYKPSTVKKQVDKLNEKLSNTVQNLAEKGINWGTKNNYSNLFIKVIKTFVAALSSPLAKEDSVQRAYSAAERELSSVITKHNAIGHLISDIIGRTNDNGEIYDLIKPIKAEVQQVRTRAREEIPQTLKEQFSRELEPEELKAIFFGLGKIDISALGLGPIVKNYFASASLVNKTIADLEQKINDPEIFKKAKELATFLVTNKITSPILLRNAEAIVARVDIQGVSTRGSIQLDRQKVKDVDQLITLYALQQLDGKTKGIINRLFNAEQKGMEVIIGSLKYLKEYESMKQQGRARFNAPKGYIPSQSTNQHSVILGTSLNDADLRKQGYIQREAYSGAPDTYYYTRDFNESPFNEGIMQIIKESSNGADIVTGFSHECYGKITGTQAENYYKRSKNSRVNSEEAFLPVFDAKGKIIGYEKHISKAIRDKYLVPDYDLTKSIGLMQGRALEEYLAKSKNEELIKKLKKVWDNTTYDQRRGFVNLEEQVYKDPVLLEAWELIPNKYKDLLRLEFQGGPIMVPATLVEDIIGIRAASIGDIFTGKSRWNSKTQQCIKSFFKAIFGADEGRAYRVLVKLENSLIAVGATLRSTIVVRSFVVPMQNIISNAIDLMMCGISPVVLAKETPKIIVQVEKYMKAQKQLLQIDTLIRSKQFNRRELETKRAAIKESIEKLTDIMPLIKAGELSTIADLNQSDDDLSYSGTYFEFLENLANKSPKELKHIMDYAIIGKNTSLYKGLQKAVLYGDFIAKCLLYKHLIQKGQQQKEVLNTIKEHFVDYDRTSGRTRGYLENTMIIWFYNYKLRIFKTALWHLRHNPLWSLLSVTLPIDLINEVGTPLTENFAIKGSDLLGSIGSDMAERAPGMNLWATIASQFV